MNKYNNKLQVPHKCHDKRKKQTTNEGNVRQKRTSSPRNTLPHTCHIITTFEELN